MMLRIAVLTVPGAPGVDALDADPNRGVLYDVACVLTPKPPRNLIDREEHDRDLAEELVGRKADYVFLAGYPYILTDPLVDAFTKRIVALHDADLSLRDADGKRKYVGMHAVDDALFAGERETRASAYFATREVGAGPLFLLSGPFPASPLVHAARAWGDAKFLEQYAALHRHWMLRAAWGQMLTRGIEFLAAGTVKVIHDLVWIDGVPGPCRMGDAPGVCADLHETLDAGIPRTCPLIARDF
jgi:formyl transferase-like protein